MKNILLYAFLISQFSFSQTNSIFEHQSPKEINVFEQQKEFDKIEEENLMNLFFAEEEMDINSGSINEYKCKKAIELFNKVNDKYLDAFAQYEIGLCYWVLKEYELSIFSFSKSISALNENKYFLRKGVYKKINDTLKITEYIQLNYTIEEAYFHRALCKIQMSDYRGALIDLSKIESTYSKSNQFSGQYFLERGKCKLSVSNYLDAKSDFTQSLKIKDNAIAYYLRGVCNQQLNLKENACIDFSKSGELGFAEAYSEIKEYCNK